MIAQQNSRASSDSPPSLCSEIRISLVMSGGKRNCKRVQQQLIDRIIEVMETPEHFTGKGQVDYAWGITCN
jgi:hypothetical protein